MWMVVRDWPPHPYSNRHSFTSSVASGMAGCRSHSCPARPGCDGPEQGWDYSITSSVVGYTTIIQEIARGICRSHYTPQARRRCQDKDGLTAFDLALQKDGFVEVKRALLEHS